MKKTKRQHLCQFKKLTDDAVKALDIFGKDESAELRELAINLLNRNK